MVGRLAWSLSCAEAGEWLWAPMLSSLAALILIQTVKGQYMAKKAQVFELTLLFAMGGSVDVVRCTARL